MWRTSMQKEKDENVNESKVVANSGQLRTDTYSLWSLDKHQYHNRDFLACTR